MVIVATLLLLMLVSSILVLSACVLSGQQPLDPERDGNLTLEMSARWSGTNFGGRYTTVVPNCRFEPEDLEEFQVAHRL